MAQGFPHYLKPRLTHSQTAKAKHPSRTVTAPEIEPDADAQLINAGGTKPILHHLNVIKGVRKGQN